MSTNVAVFTTNASQNVANIATDAVSDFRYHPRMSMNDWVVRALSRSGLSQAELGRRLSEKLGRTIDRAAVQKMTKPGGRAVRADELLAISEITGYPTIEEPTVIPIHEAEQNGTHEDIESFGSVGGRLAVPGAMREIDASAGAGEGIVGDVVSFAIGSESYSAHRVIGEWVVPARTLEQQFGMHAENSIVMRVRGDSMEPTFRSGDPVGVDLRVKSFEGDGIYVFSEPGEAPKIKRLQKVPLSSPKSVRIISDNKAYETDVVEVGSIIIHGRVGMVVSPK